MVITKPTRVRVSQPSTSQLYHRLHGMVGIAIPRGEFVHTPEIVRIYFTKGSIISQNIHSQALVEA